jgi:hypothetical protein
MPPHARVRLEDLPRADDVVESDEPGLSPADEQLYAGQWVITEGDRVLFSAPTYHALIADERFDIRRHTPHPVPRRGNDDTVAW